MCLANTTMRLLWAHGLCIQDAMPSSQRCVADSRAIARLISAHSMIKTESVVPIAGICGCAATDSFQRMQGRESGCSQPVRIQGEGHPCQHRSPADLLEAIKQLLTPRLKVPVLRPIQCRPDQAPAGQECSVQAHNAGRARMVGCGLDACEAGELRAGHMAALRCHVCCRGLRAQRLACLT